MTTVLRLIAERDPAGHWTAWYSDRPECSFGGPTAMQAIGRLVQLDRRPEFDATRIEKESGSESRVVYVLKTGPKEPCPDCGGSGTYTGLVEVEDCQTCGGTGEVDQ